jgi:uncharacterized protein
VTSNQIVEHLAREFSSTPECVRAALEMVDAGLCAPFIGRVRRRETHGMPESVVRRLDRLRRELEELDRRRATILRMLAPPAVPAATEGALPRPASTVDEDSLERVRSCMDRFELEDQLLPHRRPEPEVQLALDRGLGHLAEELIRPVPRPQRGGALESDSPEPESADEEAGAPASDEAHEEATSGAANSGAPAAHAEAAQGESGEAPGEHGAGQGAEHGPEHAAAEASAEGDDHERELEQERLRQQEREARAAAQEALLHGQIELTPALARVCAPYVNPDKGVHTEGEALAGAMRILSDRLARDPRVRSMVRRMLARQGVLSVRAADESRVGRHRPLLRIHQPHRQIQGQRLLAIRQAQKERAVNTVLSLDRSLTLPKVRAALGRHTHPDFDGVLDAVALRTLEYRLLPVLEADVRLELKERADEEALRLVAQRLRQMLLTPPLGLREVAGVDVSAKGDWTLAVLDVHGELAAPVARIETANPDDAGPKDAQALGQELAAVLVREGRLLAPTLAIGHGKPARAALSRLRAALAAAGLDVFVHVVDESGVASYAASELARKELPELSVPQRAAVSLGRRLQDPMNEILKVDPRHLGLGAEQGLVSKANLKRALDETIESCVALVGCDVNRAPLSRLGFVPGLDGPTAARLVERRAQRPFQSREELRAEGLLTEAQWTSAAAFLRVRGGSERLDESALHPEQYALAWRALEAAGTTPEEGLGRAGRPGAARNLPRELPDVDPATYRDVVRELTFPGRDPRPFQARPRLLDPQTDRATLTKDRVVEGVITSVASFGAFVDIGLEQDAMIHVSEMSERYVRDARELISVGQFVRARILDGKAARVALSLKRVPFRERGERGGRGGRPQGEREAGRGQRRPPAGQPQTPPELVRAAQTRRDGLAHTRRNQERGPRKGDGRSGGARSGERFGKGGDGRGRPRPGEDAEVRREDLERAKQSPSHKPFAAFFKTAPPPG